MSSKDTMKSRRAFLTSGGAMLGAGVATAAGAAAVRAPERAVSAAEEREALRELHLAFAMHVEHQRYGAAAALFAESARLELSGIEAMGRDAIHARLASPQSGPTHTA
jgi:hypothetical protein